MNLVSSTSVAGRRVNPTPPQGGYGAGVAYAYPLSDFCRKSNGSLSAPKDADGFPPSAAACDPWSQRTAVPSDDSEAAQL